MSFCTGGRQVISARYYLTLKESQLYTSCSLIPTALNFDYFTQNAPLHFPDSVSERLPGFNWSVTLPMMHAGKVGIFRTTYRRRVGGWNNSVTTHFSRWKFFNYSMWKQVNVLEWCCTWLIIVCLIAEKWDDVSASPPLSPHPWW